MKKFLIWMVVTCIGCGNLWAADRTVKGYVLDKEGTPLPGAYVYDEDKHTAVTNEDGYFELSVSEEIKQLRAAYVGFNALIYTMERPDDIQILVMSPSTELEEVVVTAGGTGTIKNRSNVLNTESVTSKP